MTAVTGLGRVSVVGCGQVGTAIAIALSRAAAAAGVSELVVSDLNPDHEWQCLARGGGDRAAADVADVLASDVIIVATPVPAIVAWLAEHGGAITPGTLLIDTGSAKGPVVDAMARYTSPEVRAVGGHPMAGVELPGPAAARPEALRGAPFVLCPVRGDDAAIGRAAGLVTVLGSRAVVLDAQTHDWAVGRTSHLAHVVAFALAGTLAADPTSAPATQQVVASGFDSVTRLAGSDPSMVAGFLTANADAVRRALADLRVELDRAEALLANAPALAEYLTSARAIRTDLYGASGMEPELGGR